jgi:hypothetical protein
MFIRNLLVVLGLAIALVVPASSAAAASNGTTLAQRNAYISCVAPSQGMTMTQRINALSVGFKVLEGLTAGVPKVTLVSGIKKQYRLSSSEAWSAYYCARAHLR